MTRKPITTPREKAYLAKCIARRLRFQMVCARHPYDRSVARVFGVPYERIEWWRRLFGELQSALRYASLPLNRKTIFDPAYRHDRELQLGIETFFLASFGITPKHPVRSKHDGSWNAAGEVFIDWNVGEFGPPDDMETVKRFVTVLGRTLHEYEIDDETVGNSDT